MIIKSGLRLDFKKKRISFPMDALRKIVDGINTLSS